MSVVCYVNHQGEILLKGLNEKTKLSLLSASGVRPVEQHSVEDSQLCAPGEAYHTGWQSHQIPLSQPL